MATTTKPQYESVKPEDIDSWFFQRSEVSRHRETDDGENEDPLWELARSLAEGQEEPIIIRETDQGLQGVTGYRRVRAVEEYGDDHGIQELRAERRDMSDLEAARSRLVTNVFNEPDTYMDEARLVDLVHDHMDTKTETAEYIGKSLSWVSTRLNRLEDPEEVKEAGEKGAIGPETASSLANEEDPQVREEVINFAEENPEATRAQIREKQEEARQEGTDTEAVSQILEEYATTRQKWQNKKEEEERRQEIIGELEELEGRAQDIRTEMPEDMAARHEEYQEMESRVGSIQEAIELVDSIAERLEESADSADLEEAEEAKRDTLNRELSQLESEVGRPTDNAINGDSDPVQVQETNGKELWTIRTVVDPDDVPDIVQDIRDKLEDQVAKRQQYEEYEGRIKKAESLRKRAEKVRQTVGDVLDIDTIDVGSIDRKVREILNEHQGDTLGELRKNLENHQEELGDMDQEALEEAKETHDELAIELSEINDQIADLKAEKPADNTAQWVEQYHEDMGDNREAAQEAFQELPADKQNRLLNTLQTRYDFDVSWLADDDQEREVEENGVTVDHTGGGWYEVTDGEETIKVQGSDKAEEAADTWKSDGFEAAEQIAN